MKDFVSNSMRSFACALAAAACGALAVSLMLALYDIPRTAHMAVLIWGGMLLIQSVICELLARRGGSMLMYLAACAAIVFFGGEQVVRHTVFIPGSSGFPVFLHICVWTSGAVCAYACQKEPGSNVFVRLSDILILSIGSYMAILYGLGEDMILSALALSACALLLCMLVSASLRAGGESDSVVRGAGMGGYLVIGALLGLCLLFAALLLNISSGHVSGLVEAFLAVWAVIRRAAMSALTALGVILAYLFGGQRMMERRQAVYEDSFSYSSGVLKDMGTAPQWVVYLAMALIAAAILGVILAILWALRCTRFTRSRKKPNRRRVTRRSHAGDAIRAMLARIAGALAFELRYRANRHTPQGLYVLAVRTCRAKRIPRRKHESPGAYMRRLHSLLLAQGNPSSLDRLAAMLDNALYGGMQTPLPRSEADAFAAQIHAIAAPPLIRIQKSE
ncbi:MAG: DUF4129 domain-containing protein [Clostridia bacterium]|nr:DUF4129 domain-containing protein [Clostridia bacterium]